MRLELRWPDGARSESNGRVVWEDVTAVVEPLAPHPEDFEAWLRAYLVRDVLPADRVTLLPRQDGVSDLGWPVTLLRARVTRDEGLVEQRLCVVYRMLEYFAAVTVRAPGERLAVVEPIWLAALRTARPDWRGEAAICVADLLSLEAGA